MTIRKKLQLSSIVIIFSVILFVVATLFIAFKHQELHKKMELTEQITETSFQLAILINEYLTHPSERTKVQWVSMHEAQVQLLDNGAYLFQTPQERELFENVVNVSSDKRKLFSEIIKNAESSGSALVKNQLSNQLTIKSQAAVSSVLSLEQLGQKDAKELVFSFGLIMSSLAIIILIAAILSYVISQSVTKSLTSLVEETKDVEGDNFDYKQVAIKNHDELGELTKRFNTMAIDNQVLVDQLKKEVMEKNEIKSQYENLKNVTSKQGEQIKDLKKDAQMDKIEGELDKINKKLPE